MKTIKLTSMEGELLRANLLLISELQNPMVSLGDGRVEQRKNPLKLSAKLSVSLRRIIFKLDDALKAYDVTKKELVEKHSDMGAIDLDKPLIFGGSGGERQLVKNEARFNFLTEFTPISKESIEIQVEPIRESAFKIGEKADDANIPLALMRSIRAVWEEDNAPKEKE